MRFERGESGEGDTTGLASRVCFCSRVVCSGADSRDSEDSELWKYCTFAKGCRIVAVGVEGDRERYDCGEDPGRAAERAHP